MHLPPRSNLQEVTCADMEAASGIISKVSVNATMPCPAPAQNIIIKVRESRGWVAGSQQTKQEDLGRKDGVGKSETPEL